MATLFLSAFVLGIIANLHCIGMCGPIAMAVPIPKESTTHRIIGVLQYNLGRILTYSLLGLLVGFLGMGIQLVGWLQSISIIAGFGIIIYAWRKVLFKNSFLPSFQSNKLQLFTSKSMGKLLRNRNPFTLFLLGMLNGLLPCGMVYTALITAVIAGTPFNAAASLFFFGLGTLPGMLLITYFAQSLSSRFRSRSNRLLPYFVSIIGLLIVLRGMNLNIPYLSPKASYDQQSKSVKMEACH